MKKFLVLYQSKVAANEQLATATTEEVKTGMQQWMKWAAQADGAIVDLGSPFGHARHFTSPTEATSGNGHVGGFSILQAEDEDGLRTILLEHPHFKSPGATLEVFEFLPLPGL